MRTLTIVLVLTTAIATNASAQCRMGDQFCLNQQWQQQQIQQNQWRQEQFNQRSRELSEQQRWQLQQFNQRY